MIVARGYKLVSKVEVGLNVELLSPSDRLGSGKYLAIVATGCRLAFKSRGWVNTMAFVFVIHSGTLSITDSSCGCSLY